MYSSNNYKILHDPSVPLNYYVNASGNFTCSCDFNKHTNFSVRTNQGWDLKSGLVNYMELRILKEVSAVGLGLVLDSFILVDNMPGWEPCSVGVHSDDGKLFLDQDGARIVDCWNDAGNIAGIGITASGEVFFTLNGVFVDILCKLSPSKSPIVYPCIGCSDKEKSGIEFEVVLNEFAFNLNDLPMYIEHVNNNRAVCWGAGSCGVLGNGSENSCLTPTLVQTDANFISVSAGDNHTLAISDMGKLYGWGKNDYSQISNNENPYLLYPQLVETNFKVSQVSAGESHTLALDEFGNIYSWGRGQNGVLGYEHPHRKTPKLVEIGEKFVQVKTGRMNSIALSNNGIIYYWGKWGQNIMAPKPWKGVPKFKSIALSSDCGYGLTDDGVVYIFSEGDRPIAMDFDCTIDKISANWNHFIAYSQIEKCVYTIDRGQNTVSTGDNKLIDWHTSKYSNFEWEDIKKKIELNDIRVKDISAGFKHFLILSEEGDIYSWGKGNLLGNTLYFDQYFRPKKILGFNDFVFTCISAGSSHSVALLKEVEREWTFSENLLELRNWETIGSGIEPTKRLNLKEITFLETQDGLEYEKLAKLFKKGLKGESFNITKCYAISNPTLEKGFDAEILKLRQKWHNSPDLFKHSSWADDDEYGMRDETMRHLQKYANSFEWNKDRDIPIIPVVHGTKKSAVWKICSNGFSSLAKTDAGLYGRGIYFSSNAGYASKFSENNEHCFIVSMVIPGNVYPVTEHPNKLKSLKGLPNKVGYQSHYVRVNKKGYPSSNMDDNIFDEIVVFQESQVLPIYVIFAERDIVVKKGIHRIESLTNLNRESFTLAVGKVKAAIDDSPFMVNFSYFEKMKIHKLHKEATVWLNRNQDVDDVQKAYDLFEPAMFMVHNLATELYPDKEIFEETEDSFEEEYTINSLEEEQTYNNQDLLQRIARLKRENRMLKRKVFKLEDEKRTKKRNKPCTGNNFRILF
eukprot:TRINITY_DN2133_c0_g1_i1.p1 TRINITY_DN2133_c0_g1~~TRINITY_DN2133_c0_g1_i1.p1  ORF type:complete len:986 (+),score=189.66 TRINITY_DN2133_c0_g1_i1:57-2960(+)